MVLAGKMVPAGVLGGRIRGQHGLPALRHRQLQDLGRGCCLLPEAAWIETGGDRDGAANGIHQPGHGLPRAPQLVDVRNGLRKGRRVVLGIHPQPGTPRPPICQIF